MCCYRWRPAALSATPFRKHPHNMGEQATGPKKGATAQEGQGEDRQQRVSEAAGTSRACHKSSTEIPKAIKDKSKAGPGAGRLVAPNTQGLYHQFQPGPSARKELVGVGDTVHDQLPWVEGECGGCDDGRGGQLVSDLEASQSESWEPPVRNAGRPCTRDNPGTEVPIVSRGRIQQLEQI